MSGLMTRETVLVDGPREGLDHSSVREAFVKSLITEQDTQGPYRSLHDFIDRVKPDSKQIVTSQWRDRH
jgi:hypothetical protein